MKQHRIGKPTRQSEISKPWKRHKTKVLFHRAAKLGRVAVCMKVIRGRRKKVITHPVIPVVVMARNDMEPLLFWKKKRYLFFIFLFFFFSLFFEPALSHIPPCPIPFRHPFSSNSFTCCAAESVRESDKKWEERKAHGAPGKLRR